MVRIGEGPDGGGPAPAPSFGSDESSDDAESTAVESTDVESTDVESTVVESTDAESTVVDSTDVESTVASAGSIAGTTGTSWVATLDLARREDLV